MLKKSLAFLMSLSLVFSLVGCGTSTNKTTSTSKLQIVGMGLTEEAYAKTKADPNPDKYGIATTDALKKKFPGIQILDWGWAEQLDQKQRAAILSGNAPDTVHGEIFMPTYASEDILEPLPSDIVDKVNPNFLLKNKKGEAVAVARYGNIFMLYYNKDVLKNAGVDPEIKINTWTDWKTISDQITAKGAGKVYGGGVPSHPHAGGSLRATPFLRMLNADFGGGVKATIDTPEMIKALTFVREMDKNFPKGIGNNPDEGPLYNMFEKTQNLAFVVNGTWQEQGAKNNSIKSYNAVPLPAPEGGKTNNCLVGFDYYGVPKLSKNKTEAFDAIRLQLSKEIQELCGSIPSTKVVLDDPNFKTAVDNPTTKTAIAQLKDGTFKGLVVFDKNNSQIWDVINTKVIARTTMTNDPIAQIVKEGQAEVDKLLK